MANDCGTQRTKADAAETSGPLSGRKETQLVFWIQPVVPKRRMSHVPAIRGIDLFQNDDAVLREAVRGVLQRTQLILGWEMMEDIVEDNGIGFAELVVEEIPGVKLRARVRATRGSSRDFFRVKIDANEATARKGTSEQVGEQTLAATEVEYEPCAVEQAKEEIAGIKRLF